MGSEIQIRTYLLFLFNYSVCLVFFVLNFEMKKPQVLGEKYHSSGCYSNKNFRCNYIYALLRQIMR